MRRDHTAQRLVIAVVDDFGSAAGENHLLVAFLFQIDEILLMGVADRSEDHRVGADDAFEPLHLAGFRDARFENRQFLVALQHQHRKRHAQLRIVTLRRTVIFHAFGQLLGDPLLDDGLAVRAGDADHRAPELRPVIGRQPLKGFDGVVHLHETALPGARGGFDTPLDEERTHAPALHAGDEIMRIVVRAAHGDEHRAAPQLARKRTAVGNDRPHLGIAARKLSAANGGNT